MDEVTEAVQRVCREQKGQPLQQMATALICTFLEAKMRDTKASVALYSVSSDVDGAKIVQDMGARTNRAILEMLESASEPLRREPQMVASMLQGAMAGVSRRLLESAAPEKELEGMREELIFLVRGYLEASSGRSA
jgi:hypothetical protein